MQFNWFTFFAQIVNFLILILILRHFLYRPITKAMKAREAEIAARYEEAERQTREAQHEAELFRAKRQEFDNDRDDRYAELDAEIEARRRAMYLEARNEVDVMQSRWYSAVEHERSTFLRDLRERIGEQVFRLADRSLADLADANLEKQVIIVFAERLKHTKTAERTAPFDFDVSGERNVIVRSAFELDYEQRQMMVEAIQGLPARGDTVVLNGSGRAGEITVHFERDTSLICGVEVQVSDHCIGWSLRDYLHSLEDDLAQALDSDLAVA